jgi:SAM-dependent methyltransferase
MNTYETQIKMAQYIEAEWGDAIRDSLPPITDRDLHPYGSHAASFYREAANLVCKFLPDNGSLADIGCGLGRFVYEMGNLRPKATFHLHDNSNEFTRFLQSVKGQDNEPPKLVVRTTPNADVFEIPMPTPLKEKFGEYKSHAGTVYEAFPQITCDVVTAFNVYDRVPHDQRTTFLANLKSITRKDGVLILSTPYDFKPDDMADTYDLKSLGLGEVLHEATLDYRMRTSPHYLHDYKTHLVAWRV